MKNSAKKTKENHTSYFKTKKGDSLKLSINSDGLVILSAKNKTKHSTLGSIVVTGFTPDQAIAKKKGFWGKLWAKVKKVAGDILDKVTGNVGPFTCRPTGRVGFQNSKINSFTIGVNCIN